MREIALDPPFRRARPGDAPVLARIVTYAGEGLPLLFWSRMAAPGQDPMEVGIARQREKAATGTIVVIDEGAGAIAALTGDPVPAEPVSTDGLPAVFVPLQELENLAPETWYVNVLGVEPHARGQGHGTRLLAVAEEIARAAGLAAMSIIVSDGNPGAMRLYARTGYAEAARRAIVKDGPEIRGTDWVLMIKPL